MAEPPNDMAAPSANDVEMKEEVAEPSVHSIPSAPDQVAGASQVDAALPINQPFTAEASKLEDTVSASMEGITNGDSTDAQSTQAPPPPVAQAPSASPLPATASAPTAPPAASLPVKVPTPSPAPTRPSSIGPAVSQPPERANQHGAPGRIYLNPVANYFMEGMKYLVVYQPEKPLKWMGEFLLKRSAEIEGE
ncbi:unnamed protein product [Aureobasidium mustum]|uniref:Uncharacterized protein n=1 Tax=Aureobasidium mustum TaxID=2773714 RepID=A0A9N8K231_9PEZI|nr:unnamed protein product [Aureobasidium mustum]